ncbi:MAG: TolC family protein [Gemmatimonadota bacterium]|nr:TolC family protein [Gemmatimonadota bacterium]
MKALLLALLVPALLAGQVADSSARPISLDEAIRLAQRYAPLAVAARGQLETSSEAVRASYAAFIPNLSVNAVRSYVSPTGGRVENGRLVNLPNWASTDGISSNVNLFDGGRRFYNIGAAKANVGAAEANEVTQRFTVALTVQQAFFNALAARESEGAALAQLQQAQEQLKQANARVAAGAATRSDSLRSVIAIGNAQLALLTARNNLTAANAALTRLVASPFQVTASSTDTVGLATVATDSVALAALAASGPAVHQAEAQQIAARSFARAARTPYLPSLDLSYGLSGSGSDIAYGLSNPFNYANSLRFTLSYPIFNQFQREQARVQADVAAANAEASLRDARLAAQQTLVQNLGSLHTAQQRVSIQLASVAAAEEDLRVQQQRYAVGASTLLDVLNSQTTLNQARAALIQARYDYRVAKAQLEALIGRPL